MIKLTEKEILSQRGYHAAETVITTENETFRHTHEFYELFLTMEGEVYHRCNQTEELLLQGTLCLVRPEDMHNFRKASGKSVHFLNLAFSAEVYEACERVWKEFYSGSVERRKAHVRVPGNLAQGLAARILYLMKCMTDVEEVSADGILRGILLDSFTCLESQEINREIVPGWLENTCRKMKKKENYMEGISRFVELSGKSQEHLTRMMKRYYRKTPSAYLNSIRLEQTAFLLRTTEKSVLDIMLESGFNNVSYFNQRFKEEFGLSPTSYRRFNRQVINPEAQEKSRHFGD